MEELDFSIFEEFKDEVVVIDKNYRIIYANKKYIEDVGCKNHSEVIGHFCYKVSHHQDEPCEDTCHPCPLREIEKTGRSVNVVHTHYTHDNKEFPVEICAFPIRNGEFIVQIIRNIKSDKEKYWLFSMSQKLSSVGFLAMGIAHQLNTPLNTALIALEDLESKLGESEDIELIKSSIQTCKDYIDKMFMFVKRRSKKDIMSVHKAVSDVVEILQVYAKERDVELLYESSWEGYFIGDESDIRHLALNLILNAIQASPAGGRVLVELSQSGDNWILSIEDEGEGIDPEEMSKIFIPFYQGRNKCDGTGLGLAIVDSIVKEYGGSIQVDSLPGKGSVFKVSIPISDNF